MRDKDRRSWKMQKAAKMKMKIKMMTMQLLRRLEMMTKKQIKKKEVMRNPRVQLLLLEMRHRETQPIEKVVMIMLLQQIKRL
jgi:hypothetical protein